MKKAYITTNYRQTQKLGEMLAKELRGGEIICLTGELGSGKTTFAQGVLKGLGAKGPYTSPTFLVMKNYKKKMPKLYQSSAFPLQQTSCRNSSKPSFIQNIYHIDCYRVKAQDIIELGWEEIIANKKNIIIIEWAEKIKRIVPAGAVWIKFRHKGKNEREITIRAKSEKLKCKSNN